jgi:hypothetical protein
MRWRWVDWDERKISQMKTASTKTLLLILLGLTGPAALGGCAVVAGAAVIDYFVDDNDVCDGPNDVGLIDSDCHDSNKSR